MPNINYAFKEITCKIVYYGPGAGGKTTNLQFVHGQVPQKHRGDLVSLATEQDRTLFFDYLPLDIGDVKGFKTKFQLYTVPGQVFYNQTRKLVLRGVDGIVFVADSGQNRFDDNLNSMNNLVENLKEYDLTLDEVPFVMQYNKRDLPDAVPVEKLQELINPENKYVWFEGVATDGTGCRESLKEVSTQILRKLNATANIVSDEEVVADRLGVNPIASTPDATLPGPGGAPELDILQRTKFRWHGLSVGNGTVTLSTSKSALGLLEYQLKSSHKILGSKRSLVRVMKYVGEDKRSIEGEEKTYYVLRDGSASGEQAPVSAFVEKISTPKLYIVYPGIGGEVKAGPDGEANPF